MTAVDEFEQAKVDAEHARATLTATLVDIQARLNPRALARDAIGEMREVAGDLADRMVTAAKQNPVPLIGIGATIIGILAKDWIIDAFAARSKDATDTVPLRSQPHQGVAMSLEGQSDD